MAKQPSRRQFIGTSSMVGASLIGSPFAKANPGGFSELPRWRSERIGIGGIGLRYQGSVDLHTAKSYGDVVAVCDVDKNVRDQAKASFGSRPASFEDYRKLLELKSVDAVVIATPDHWHVKMAVDALRAKKHVYVEKPLTLTIAEGKLLRRVVQETGGVLQVGSWQRSDAQFRLAVELVRAGRIGKLQKVEVVLGKNQVGGPFEIRKIPRHLNWDLWQGQTPSRPYVEERSHYTFRWWLEYSGGQMTDWGCHHVDIAQWAINSKLVHVETRGRFPEPDGNSFNVPIDFFASYRYQNGVVMTVSDHGRNGILFHGDRGRIFVNRGTVSGKPVEELKQRPLDREDFQLYDFDNRERPQRSGKLESIVNHFGNFVDCIEANKTPVSDVVSQDQTATTCHLANISLRLKRALKWNPDSENVENDRRANEMLTREQRQGYELV